MKKWIIISIIAVLTIALSVIGIFYWKKIKYQREIEALSQVTEEVVVEPEVEPTYLYGIAVDSLIIIEGVVKRKQTFSDILKQYNVSPQTIAEITKLTEPVFDLKTIRSGNPYVMICNSDTVPLHFVYEQVR